MNLLWVKVGGLWPVTTGGRLRSFHILSELSRRHRVTLLTTHGPGDDPDGLAAALPSCGVVSVPWAPPKQGSVRFGLALGASWLSALPVDLYRSRVPALGRLVVRGLARGGVDLVLADFLAMVERKRAPMALAADTLAKYTLLARAAAHGSSPRA